jgi:hypothetical protein
VRGALVAAALLVSAGLMALVALAGLLHGPTP